LAVTWPDRLSDGFVGKMTLATLWQPDNLRLLYRISLIASYTSLILLGGWLLPRVIVLSSLLALPFLIWGAYSYTHNEISKATVHGLIVMILAQIVGWNSLGLQY
jgi:hypothetical protein